MTATGFSPMAVQSSRVLLFRRVLLSPIYNSVEVMDVQVFRHIKSVASAAAVDFVAAVVS